MAEPIFMKLGMYIMALEPISAAYFINPTRHSVCLYAYPLSLIGNGSVKDTAVRNKYATTELLDATFFMRSVSYQRKAGDWFFPELVFKK
jgi:hypothetical protein